MDINCKEDFYDENELSSYHSQSFETKKKPQSEVDEYEEVSGKLIEVILILSSKFSRMVIIHTTL